MRDTKVWPGRRVVMRWPRAMLRRATGGISAVRRRSMRRMAVVCGVETARRSPLRMRRLLWMRMLRVSRWLLRDLRLQTARRPLWWVTMMRGMLSLRAPRLVPRMLMGALP